MENEKRLLDKQDVIKLLRGACVAKYPSTFMMGLFAAADEISKLPEVDAVKHGRWIGGYMGLTYIVPKCSQCGYRNGAVGAANYCPHCGARMDGDGNG